MNHERLRVIRFRKSKTHDIPIIIPIAKPLKAIAMPIQIAELVKEDEYYENGYFHFPPLCINIAKRHWRKIIKLIAYALYADKNLFSFQYYEYNGKVVACIHFPPIPLSVTACLFANELYKRQFVATWYNNSWYRLTVLS